MPPLKAETLVPKKSAEDIELEASADQLQQKVSALLVGILPDEHQIHGFTSRVAIYETNEQSRINIHSPSDFEQVTGAWISNGRLKTIALRRDRSSGVVNTLADEVIYINARFGRTFDSDTPYYVENWSTAETLDGKPYYEGSVASMPALTPTQTVDFVTAVRDTLELIAAAQNSDGLDPTSLVAA